MPRRPLLEMRLLTMALPVPEEMRTPFSLLNAIVFPMLVVGYRSGCCSS